MTNTVTVYVNVYQLMEKETLAFNDVLGVRSRRVTKAQPCALVRGSR